MKWITYLASGLLVLILLVLAAAGVMLATFDPNNYKDEITTIVQNNTGRTLTINGPIALTYYPVFGFSVKDATLSNPPGFEEKDFAAIEELQAGVEILPLLEGNIKFDTIRAVNPVINIIRRADGTHNLSFKTERAEAAAAEDLEETAEKEGFLIRTGEIMISKASVNYTDQGTGKSYHIEPLNFSLSSFAFQESADMSLNGTIKTAPTQLGFNITGNVAINPQGNTIRIDDLLSEIHLENPALSKEVDIKMQGNLLTALDARQASLKNGRIEWNSTLIQADGLYGWGGQKETAFTLAANRVDIDKILAVMAPAEQKPQAPEQQPAQQQTAAPQQLPVGFLRDLSADGTVSIGTIKAAGLTFSNFQATIKGENGLFNIDPIVLNLYEGKLSSARKVDARGNTLRIHEQGRIENIALAGLLRDLLGKEYVSGTASVDYDLNTSGNNTQALMNALGGSVAFQANEGYINHWQLSKRINQAINFFETGSLDEEASERIRFTTLNARFQGQNGLFRNDDLMLIGPKMHALGSGQVNLAQKNVDYTMQVGLGDDPETFAQTRHLPVTMSGPFSELRYGIDVEDLVKQEALQKIEEQKQDIMGKALEKFGIGGDETQVEPAAGPNGGTNGDAPQAEEDSTDKARQMIKGLLGGE